jgi:hypothetical protein
VVKPAGDVCEAHVAQPTLPARVEGVPAPADEGLEPGAEVA